MAPVKFMFEFLKSPWAATSIQCLKSYFCLYLLNKVESVRSIGLDEIWGRGLVAALLGLEGR